MMATRIMETVVAQHVQWKQSGIVQEEPLLLQVCAKTYVEMASKSQEEIHTVMTVTLPTEMGAVHLEL